MRPEDMIYTIDGVEVTREEYFERLSQALQGDPKDCPAFRCGDRNFNPDDYKKKGE